MLLEQFFAKAMAEVAIDGADSVDRTLNLVPLDMHLHVRALYELLVSSVLPVPMTWQCQVLVAMLA